MPKAAIFHTNTATLPVMKDLVAEMMPQVEVMHIVEDSMIKDVMANNGMTADISARIFHYMQAAEKAGCNIFMTACSSIGHEVEQCRPYTKMRIERIDTAMLEQALKTASKISVLATVETTMAPTVEYLKRLAQQKGKSIEVKTHLMPDAFTALLEGDTEYHDQTVQAGLSQSLEESEVIILAQASMARAVPKDTEFSVPILTSPELGITRLAEITSTL